jgi:hypothetical protein
MDALADRRVRGEFKNWRDSYAQTPRKADYAWATLARIMSFAKDRGTIAVKPCEKGGRLYAADRTDKFWDESGIAVLLAHIRLRQSKTGRRIVMPAGFPLKALLVATERRGLIVPVNSYGRPWRRLGPRPAREPA